MKKIVPLFLALVASYSIATAQNSKFAGLQVADTIKGQKNILKYNNEGKPFALDVETDSTTHTLVFDGIQTPYADGREVLQKSGRDATTNKLVEENDTLKWEMDFNIQELGNKLYDHAFGKKYKETPEDTVSAVQILEEKAKNLVDARENKVTRVNQSQKPKPYQEPKNYSIHKTDEANKEHVVPFGENTQLRYKINADSTLSGAVIEKKINGLYVPMQAFSFLSKQGMSHSYKAAEKYIVNNYAHGNILQKIVEDKRGYENNHRFVDVEDKQLEKIVENVVDIYHSK